MFRTTTWLTALCSLMVNAVLFGVGAITVLSVPSLAEQAKYLIPVVVVFSFALAPFISIWVARRMRIQNWGREEWRKGDVISG